MSVDPPSDCGLYGARLCTSMPLPGLSSVPKPWTELSLDWQADPAAPVAGRFWTPPHRPAWVSSLAPARVALASQADSEGLNLLASSLLPAWLAHAGALVLRGSAVRMGEGARLVLGTSMIGKSTLTAALVRAGAELISDDVVVLRRDPAGHVIVHPGAPWLKLWPAYAKAFYGQVEARRAERVAGKCRLQLPVATTALPVTASGLLIAAESGGTVRPLAAAAALDALGNLQRRAVLAPAAAVLADQFRMLCALQRQAPLQLLVRSGNGPRAYQRLVECWLNPRQEVQPA